MGLIVHLNVLLSCYLLYLYVYGSFVLLLESTNDCLGLCFIFFPLTIFAVIKFISIPQPNENDVKVILGIDIWQQYKQTAFEKINDNNIIIESNDLAFRTIAHRSAGLDAPENSISALKVAHEKGCNFVEIDLMLTKDNVPIVFHDYTLDRMVGVQGNVQDFLWEELLTYDLIYQPDIKEKKIFYGEKIARFDEFINLCVELGIRVFIDVKDRRDEVVKIILDTYTRHPSLYRSSLVSSFNPLILYKIRRCNPKIVCSLAWRPNYFSRKAYNPISPAPKRYSSIFLHIGALMLDTGSSWLVFNLAYYLIGLSAILIHKDAISLEMISRWQNRNVRVIAWTVNSKIEKDYFSNILNIPYMTDSLDYCHLNNKEHNLSNNK